MAINNNVVKNYQTAEYGKFVEIINSSQFPPVSVVRLSYPDTSSAFPSNSGLKPLSSVDIYPKYAVLSYIANPEDISISLSAGNINVNLVDVENLLKAQLGQSGFTFIVGGETASSGPYTTVQITSAAKISAIAATNSTIGRLTAFELPANFSFNGPITSITLQYGAAFVYKL
jgi:hypothetical protein